MRIALCLSGQARFVEQGYNEVLYPFILKDNNIDIFIHTWDINKTQIGSQFLAGDRHPVGEPITVNLIDKTLKLYNPKKHIVEPQQQFPIFPWAPNHMPGFYSKNVYSMFYSIHQSNKLKSEYEIENNFKYDWVIRSRFDIMLNSKINFNEFNNNVINNPNGCFNNEKGYTDCFAFSNSKNMDVYSDTYNYIDNCMNDSTLQLCGEYILRKWIDINNIPVVSSIWHGLYR